MEISYVNSNTNCYIEICMDKELSNRFSYKLSMLEENYIPYVIRPVRIEIDGKLSLRYETGSNYILQRMLLRVKPNVVLLQDFLEQICECAREISKYLMSVNDIVLDPQYILYDMSKKRINLVCLPGYDKNFKEQIKGFLEYMMKKFDYKDRDGVELLYYAYELILQENMDVISFCDLLGKRQAAKIINTGIRRLIPLNNGALPEINLDPVKTKIVIGRGSQNVDYRILSTKVSRIHAEVICSEGDVYVCDRESTNGTFVNSKRIQANEKRKLASGDTIGFANEEFYVN